MPAYAVSLVNVTNADQYPEYAKRAGPAVAKHGGRFLARGGAKAIMEGDVPFARVVVVEFPTMEQAKAFYNSPEYQEARSHRLGAADFNMVIVDGFTPP